MQRTRILAELQEKARLLTTLDAAKQLRYSRSRIRQLALAGQLRFELTKGGQFIFHEHDVHRFLEQRAEARTQSRAARLRAVRVTMLKAGIQPRQLEMFRGQAKVRCAIA